VSADRLTLTTYFGERDRTPDRLLADELLDLFGAQGVHTSILLRGADGYGRGQRLHTDRLLSLSEDLPVVAIAVDEAELSSLLAGGWRLRAPKRLGGVAGKPRKR